MAVSYQEIDPVFIGDIHGCIAELEQLVSEIPGNRTLVFLGDYVDRGPDSRAVLDLCMSLEDRSIFLKGNHEESMERYLKNGEYPAWISSLNGGDKTLANFGMSFDSTWNDLEPEYREFIQNLPVFQESDDWIAVHAGVNPKGPFELEKQDRMDLLWIRHEWIENESKWKGKFVFYGHTPSVHFTRSYSVPIRGKNSLGLDTGCVYGGYLSAWDWRDEKLIQVESQQKRF